MLLHRENITALCLNILKIVSFIQSCSLNFALKETLQWYIWSQITLARMCYAGYQVTFCVFTYFLKSKQPGERHLSSVIFVNFDQNHPTTVSKLKSIFDFWKKWNLWTWFLTLFEKKGLSTIVNLSQKNVEYMKWYWFFL